MKQLLTTAPGKMVISGEYAVLEGFPALSIAVKRYVQITSSVNKDKNGQSSDLKSTPENSKRPSRLLDCFLKTLKMQKTPFEAKRLHINSDDLYTKDASGTLKLGLGSSAAVATGLAAHVLHLNSGETNRDEIFRLAHQAHQMFTEKKGSGIDVATACYGGLIEFQMNSYDILPRIKAVKPKFDTSNLVGVFANLSQSTNVFLKKTTALKAANTATYQDIICQLGNISEQIIKLFKRKDSFELLRPLIFENVDLLQSLGKHAGIDLVPKTQRTINEIALDHGGFSKPSGAGGGDSSLCFILKENHSDFRNALISQGFKTHLLDFYATGVQNKVIAN